MLVNQIATILNSVFTSETQETQASVQEDLSNIVSVGQTITASTDFGDNFDNYVAKIVDKVGLTLYGTKYGIVDGLGLIRYGLEYASAIEKIRVDVGDYEDNKAWQLTDSNIANSFTDLFNFVPATVDTIYYNQAGTFKVKISIPEYQVKSAFKSREDMIRFFDFIEIRVKTKMQLALKYAEKRLLNNFIAEKIHANNGVINLLAEYRNATGDTTVTVTNCLSSKEFLRFASKTIGVYRSLLHEESGIFNVSNYVTHTSDDELKMFFLTDFAKALESYLLSDTYHDNYVKQDGYREIAFWQNYVDGSVTEKSRINVKIASDNTTAVNQTGILAVLLDKDACFIASEQPNVKALPNPDGDFTNYWHKFKACWYNDLAENGIVFIVQNPS